MNFVEYPIGHCTNVPARAGTDALRCFRSPLLADIVDAIWDCDIPDENLAKSLTIKCAPGTSLQLIGQYRKPADIHQRARRLPTKCATHIQSHALTLRPTGSLGVVIVSLRSDAASRIVKAPLKDFANADLYLGDLFGARDVAMCDELLQRPGPAKNGSPVSRRFCSGIFAPKSTASPTVQPSVSGNSRPCR